MANITPIIALVLASSVVLSGAHAKDIAAMPNDHAKTVAHDDQPVKIASELHNHVDKGGKTMVKVMNDTPQADSRSLRLRDKKQATLRSHWNAMIKQWSEDITLHLS